MGPTRPWSGILRAIEDNVKYLFIQELVITSKDFVKTIFIFATIDSSSFESAIVLDQSAIGQSVRKMELAQWLNKEFHRQSS